jgi:hypothetical protein
MQCQCGFADGYILKERVQSRQAIVPRPGTVAACKFEVFEELPQESCIEVLHPQFGGRASEALGRETEQQAEGVPISCYGVRAGAKLFLQSVGKETLDERLKAGTSHRLPPGCRLSKAFRGKFEEFRNSLEIPVGIGDIHMTEVRCQFRQFAPDV